MFLYKKEKQLQWLDLFLFLFYLFIAWIQQWKVKKVRRVFERSSYYCFEYLNRILVYWTHATKDHNLKNGVCMRLAS